MSEKAKKTTFTYSTLVQIPAIRIRIIFSFLLEKKPNFCDAYENYITQILAMKIRNVLVIRTKNFYKI